LRVLLADDSPLMLDRLHQCVSCYHMVDIAGLYENGTDALEALKTQKADLAILDIQMPGYTGLEILHEIRKENKAIKIIILTLFSSEYYHEIAIKEGANYFFSKVDDFEKIRYVLEEMLAIEVTSRFNNIHNDDH
jgi:DNA-binding NarL/FixJ family response regulator